MLKLTVVSPERKIVADQQVEEVIVPAHRGQLNILSNHSPLMTTLETGVLKWRLPGQDVFQKAAISWGYCTVSASNVHILAELVFLPEEVNSEAQTQSISQNLSKLASQQLSDLEWAQTQREVGLARAALEILPYQ